MSERIMMMGRRFATGAAMMVAMVVGTAPARAIDLTGAWATDAAQCTKVFEKKGNQIAFSELSDLYGSGFVIDGDRIRGKAASCTIKSRKEEGDTLHLLANCASEIMLQTVQFSLKVLTKDSISRIFPGMEGMSINYYRCTL
jgi:hypothetical protein